MIMMYFKSIISVDHYVAANRPAHCDTVPAPPSWGACGFNKETKGAPSMHCCDVSINGAASQRAGPAVGARNAAATPGRTAVLSAAAAATAAAAPRGLLAAGRTARRPRRTKGRTF